MLISLMNEQIDFFFYAKQMMCAHDVLVNKASPA